MENSWRMPLPMCGSGCCLVPGHRLHLSRDIVDTPVRRRCAISKARLIITAVVVEGRSKSDVARDYDVSRQWVHRLVARYRAEGEAAYRPRSRRPHSNPRAVAAEIEDQIIRLRKELDRKGLDAGADTIRSLPSYGWATSLSDRRGPW